MNDNQAEITIKLASKLVNKFAVAGAIGSMRSEDAIAECCLKVTEEFHRFDESRASFSTWAYRVIHNLLVDIKRRSFIEPRMTEYIEFSTCTPAETPYTDESGPPGLPPAYCQDGHWTASPDSQRDYEDLIRQVRRFAKNEDEVYVLIAVAVDNATFSEVALEFGCTRQWANQLFLSITERIRRCGKSLNE